MVFMCCPLDYRQHKSKTWQVQHGQEVFGNRKLSPDEALKEFSATKYFIPGNRSDCEEQLRVMVQFLETLTGERSITSSRYK